MVASHTGSDPIEFGDLGSKVADVEVSAFSECFLFSFSNFSSKYFNDYSHNMISDSGQTIFFNCPIINSSPVRRHKQSGNLAESRNLPINVT